MKITRCPMCRETAAAIGTHPSGRLRPHQRFSFIAWSTVVCTGTGMTPKAV